MRIYNSTITGSLKIKGDIEAENYIVNTTVTVLTQSFSSGSTIFGDSQDDNHDFTGSLNVTGSISITPSNSDIMTYYWKRLFILEKCPNQGIKNEDTILPILKNGGMSIYI